MPAKPLSTRLRDGRNRPPDEPWIWLTRTMLESAAWRTLSRAARLVIDRVILEHMSHAGTENGNLIVTYDDFEKCGIRRSSLKAAIGECVERGLIIVTQKGRASAGPNRATKQVRIGLVADARWLSRQKLLEAMAAKTPSSGKPPIHPKYRK